MSDEARIQALERENRILRSKLKRTTANLARLEDDKEANAAFLRSVIREMTEKEELLVEKNAALKAATAAKSIFLANMSHELRTPLNAVIGYSEFLLEDPNVAQLADQELTAVVGASRSLLGLLNDILDLTKIESGHLEFDYRPFAFRELVDGVVATLEPLARRKGLTFEEELPELSRRTVGDELRIRQILLNLVSNAIKFTEVGTVRICGTVAGGDLQICVTDSGVGMTPEQVARVFEPFVQADVSTTRRFGGTGLGLSIARSLTRLMGGDLAVESEPGVGTRFCLVLPLSFEAQQDALAS